MESSYRTADGFSSEYDHFDQFCEFTLSEFKLDSPYSTSSLNLLDGTNSDVPPSTHLPSFQASKIRPVSTCDGSHFCSRG